MHRLQLDPVGAAVHHERDGGEERDVQPARRFSAGDAAAHDEGHHQRGHRVHRGREDTFVLNAFVRCTTSASLLRCVLDLFAGADEEEHRHRLREEAEDDGAEREEDVLRDVARARR